jgi:hypothetical protein
MGLLREMGVGTASDEEAFCYGTRKPAHGVN